MINVEQYLLITLPDALAAYKVRGVRERPCQQLIQAMTQHVISMIPRCQDLTDSGLLMSRPSKRQKAKKRFEYQLQRVGMEFCGSYVDSMEVSIHRGADGWLECNDGFYNPRFLRLAANSAVETLSRRKRKPGGGTRKVENFSFSFRKIENV